MTDEFQVTWGKNESLCLNLLVRQVRVHPNSSHLNLIGWESWKNGSQKKIKVLLKKKNKSRGGKTETNSTPMWEPRLHPSAGKQASFPSRTALWSVLENHRGKPDSMEQGWEVTFVSSLVPETRARVYSPLQHYLWLYHSFLWKLSHEIVCHSAWITILIPLIMFRKNQQSDRVLKMNILSIQQWIWK